ncbi:Flp family type IVb pilin [Paenalcaligenes hominis]|uniref:Flp family type IVb pilin n=1 Tax=Paenalcaligenes hominis TaxID=643674 RepID=UPI0035236FBF
MYNWLLFCFLNGATAIEYALILELIAVGIIGTLTVLGININDLLNNISKVVKVGEGS